MMNGNNSSLRQSSGCSSLRILCLIGFQGKCEIDPCIQFALSTVLEFSTL
jgi:hypothetical protein